MTNGGNGNGSDSMRNDIDQAIKLMIEVSQCIDRVHRGVFPAYDEWQDDLMTRADAAQKRLRDTRKTMQKLKLLYERGPKISLSS